MKGNFIYLCGIVLCILFSLNKGIAQNNSSDTVYNMVDTKPVFPGDLYTYIRQNTHYPETALEGGTEGIVFVSFVITKTGQVTDVKVEKVRSPELDDEAVKVVKNMPAWIPGKMQGVAVSVRMYLPIKFTIKADGHQISDADDLGPKGNFATRRGLYIVPILAPGIGKIETDLQFGVIGGGLGTGGEHFMLSEGCGLGYMINNHFGIFLGAQLENYKEDFVPPHGYNITSNFSTNEIYQGTPPANNTYPVGSNTNVTYSFYYLEVPLLAKYISSKPGRAGLDLEAGYLYGVPLHASETGTVDVSTETFTPHKYTSNSWYYSSVSSNNYALWPNSNPNINRYDNGVMLNAGVFIPITNRYSVSVSLLVVHKFSATIGNGNNDVVYFPNGSYNYFSGNYGQANSYLIGCKLFIHLGKQGAKKL